MKSLLLFSALIFSSLCSAQFASEDDILHFSAGAIISGGTYTLVYSETKNKSKAFWYSLAASTFVGLSKELYDKNIANGRFDTGEMIATFSGALFVSYSFNIFTGKRKKKKRLKQKEVIGFIN